MRLALAIHGPLAALFAASALLTFVPLAHGQTRLYYEGAGGVCSPAPAPCPVLPAVPAPALPPAPAPSPTPGGTPAPQEGAAPATDLALDQRFGGLGGETVALSSSVGYIDSAIPQTRVRVRYDSGFDDNRPDRAEFFYAKCGCFSTLAPTNPLFDPHAPGPQQQPRKIDFQEQSTYFEAAYDHRLSAFLEVPIRFIDFDQRLDIVPGLHSNLAGLSDINAGFKYAVVAGDDHYLTTQLRVFTPTGDSHRGLGTDHVSLEPAILFNQRLTDQLVIEGEFRDFIPIGGTDFAGNVLRYGVGLGYEVYRTHSVRVEPIIEFVGWTVLSGKEFDPGSDSVLDAAGETIVNVKGGVRTYFSDHSDVYVGYGRALTGAVWYKDILRVEYRLTF